MKYLASCPPRNSKLEDHVPLSAGIKALDYSKAESSQPSVLYINNQCQSSPSLLLVVPSCHQLTLDIPSQYGSKLFYRLVSIKPTGYQKIFGPLLGNCIEAEYYEELCLQYLALGSTTP